MRFLGIDEASARLWDSPGIQDELEKRGASDELLSAWAIAEAKALKGSSAASAAELALAFSGSQHAARRSVAVRGV